MSQLYVKQKGNSEMLSDTVLQYGARQRDLFTVSKDFIFSIGFDYENEKTEFFKKMQSWFAQALNIPETDEQLKDAGPKKYSIGSPTKSSLEFTNPIDIYLVFIKLRELFINGDLTIDSLNLVEFEENCAIAWQKAAEYAKGYLQKNFEENRTKIPFDTIYDKLVAELGQEEYFKLNSAQHEELAEKVCLEIVQRERSRCQNFIEHYTHLQVCEDSLKAYVHYGAHRSATVAMDCSRKFFHLNEDRFTEQDIEFVCQKPFDTHKKLGQALFDLDPFEFVAQPKLEEKAKVIVSKKLKASLWNSFRSYIATNFKGGLLHQILNSLTSNETLASEGDAKAQYALWQKLKHKEPTRAEYWLAHATLADEDTIKAKACYDMASLSIAKYMESNDLHSLKEAAKWCKRAALTDDGQGLKPFLEELFNKYAHITDNYGVYSILPIVKFLAKESTLVTIGLLKYKSAEFSQGLDLYSLIARSSYSLENPNSYEYGEPWDDKTAIQAVDCLAKLEPSVLEKQLKDMTLHNCFYKSPKACMQILTKPSLMACCGIRPESCGTLLKDAFIEVLALTRKNTAQIPPELKAYIQYAHSTDLTEYNKHCTGLRGVSSNHKAILNQIALSALTNPEYRELIDSIYQIENSCFTQGISKQQLLDGVKLNANEASHESVPHAQHPNTLFGSNNNLTTGQTKQQMTSTHDSDKDVSPRQEL